MRSKSLGFIGCSSAFLLAACLVVAGCDDGAATTGGAPGRQGKGTGGAAGSTARAGGAGGTRDTGGSESGAGGRVAAGGITGAAGGSPGSGGASGTGGSSAASGTGGSDSRDASAAGGANDGGLGTGGSAGAGRSDAAGMGGAKDGGRDTSDKADSGAMGRDASSGQDLTPAQAKGKIDMVRYQACVTKLASAEFEGRKYGTAGDKKTVDYVASVFAEAGLEPLSDGSYLMPFGNAGYNTIGLLRGRDTGLAKKVIIFGGHHDHLGNTGCLYAGANDNASGTCAVMEFALVFGKHLKTWPKASIQFMTFDGEERGCLGSVAYIKKPTFPVADTLLMINLDMIGGPNPPRGSALKALRFPMSGGILDEGEAWSESGLRSRIKYRTLEDGGGACSFDRDTFRGAGVKTQNYFTGDVGNYHQCTDTADKMVWSTAQKTMNAAFDVLIKAVEDATL